MWGISKPTIERKIADAFGYEYCTLFESARAAIRSAWRHRTFWEIPSNVCRELLWAMPGIVHKVAVSPYTGLAAGAGVSLYGYKDFAVDYEIDPLMTGYLRKSRAKETVISFGRKKMLDLGYGGALLSNEKFRGPKPHFNPAYEGWLWRFENFGDYIYDRWRQIDSWDRLLGDSCIRVVGEQIMPWRVMRRIPEKRDAVVKAIREAGHPVGTNYSPLTGVTDAGAIQWGKEVINFFPESDAMAISEIVKRTLAQ